MAEPLEGWGETGGTERRRETGREKATEERGIDTDDDREQRRASATALSSLESPCSASF